MMKKAVAISLTLAGLTLAGCGGAMTEKLIETGNDAFAQQDYATALSDYQQAAVENPGLAEPIYNAANVQYRQGEFEQTSATLQVALANADEDLAAEGYFNLGNTLFQTEKYAEAVDAYAESLRLNPHDMDAKVNLELALQKLQQEQEEQQQDEQNQDQDQQEQESQDEQSQDEQNQDEQSQDEQSQDEQSQGQQDQQNEQNQEQQNQEQQSQDEQSQDQQNQNEQQAQENQEQQGQGEQEQDKQEENQEQQSQNEQSQGEQGEEQRDESEPQDSETETGEEGEEQEQPQPGQSGGEPTDEEQNLTEMSLGELLEMEGLSEEQARQLLVAAAQGTETLQEYLQQMYVFPHSDVEQDW